MDKSVRYGGLYPIRPPQKKQKRRKLKTITPMKINPDPTDQEHSRQP